MKRVRLALLAGVVLVLALAGWYRAASEAQATDAVGGAAVALGATPVGASAPAAAAALASEQRAPLSAAGLQARQAQLVLWRARAEQAEQTYASYRDATRYPPESRPIAEHPDQVRPFAPVTEEKTLRSANGDKVAGLRLRTAQERVFLSGAETVKFSIEALDERGRSLPLVVSSASAQSVADTRSPVRLIQTGVLFSDDGNGADDAPGDGLYQARLNPAQQGFAGYAGTIRLLAQVSVKGEQGVAHFDVIYTPQVPATWGEVREALERGSLNFYLKAHVVTPGRYVVSARVDDANGAPFALLQFNDELAAGAREVKLPLFGALVRDKAPTFPLHLRDVEGFVLIADKFPDRAMMARQSGVVHTSARYGVDRFSPDEWSSEERARYLAEYGKDAEAARAAVERLQAP